MSDIYNNFGIQIDPNESPSSVYNNYGVIDSSLPALSTVSNRVTESVNPNALSTGYVIQTLRSPNYVSGSAGWQISPDGSVEFSSGTFRGSISGASFSGITITGSTISGGTITGSTFKTNSSLPSSGSGIVITSDTITAYNSGNATAQLSGSSLSFASSAGISSATVQGASASQMNISVANGGGLAINTSFLSLLNGITGSMDLGTSTLRWGTVYATNGTINTSDERVKYNILPLNYGLAEVLKLNPIRYSMYEKDNRIGFSAQALNKIIPEATINCEEGSEIGSAGIRETDLIPILVNAIKELKSEIDILRSMISTK